MICSRLVEVPNVLRHTHVSLPPVTATKCSPFGLVFVFSLGLGIVERGYHAF